jgi:Glycosyl hydrolases family 31
MLFSFAKYCRNLTLPLSFVLLAPCLTFPQAIDRLSNGAVLHTSEGAVRLEACSPTIIAETEVDKEFVAKNLVLKSAASSGEPGETKERENWADLFNPQAQKLFWADINPNLFSSGLDGWWLDASEPEGDPLKEDTTFLGAGRKVSNAFLLFETTAVYRGQRACRNSHAVCLHRRTTQRNHHVVGETSPAIGIRFAARYRQA